MKIEKESTFISNYVFISNYDFDAQESTMTVELQNSAFVERTPCPGLFLLPSFLYVLYNQE